MKPVLPRIVCLRTAGSPSATAILMEGAQSLSQLAGTAVNENLPYLFLYDVFRGSLNGGKGKPILLGTTIERR